MANCPENIRRIVEEGSKKIMKCIGQDVTKYLRGIMMKFRVKHPVSSV
jgi:hypothetical protein